MSEWIEIKAIKPNGKFKRYLVKREDVRMVISWPWYWHEEVGTSTGIYLKGSPRLTQIVLKTDCYEQIKKAVQDPKIEYIEVKEERK